jgi:hypothetical protein
MLTTLNFASSFSDLKSFVLRDPVLICKVVFELKGYTVTDRS